MSESDSLPTIDQVVADLQVIATRQVGTDEILRGINAINYAANTTLATALGQLSDQIASLGSGVNARFGSLDANIFAISQRVNSMSDVSTQIAAEVAVLKSDLDTTKAGIDAMKTSIAQALADAQAHDTTDAASLAALQALHDQASGMNAGMASSSGSSGDTGATASAPTGDPAPAPTLEPAPTDPSAPPATDPAAPAPAPTDPNAPPAPTTADPSAPPAEPAPASPTPAPSGS